MTNISNRTTLKEGIFYSDSQFQRGQTMTAGPIALSRASWWQGCMAEAVYLTVAETKKYKGHPVKILKNQLLVTYLL